MEFDIPGMQVRVVNSQAAASDVVSVTAFNRDDFPTEGNPMRATRPSPLYMDWNGEKWQPEGKKSYKMGFV